MRIFKISVAIFIATFLSFQVSLATEVKVWDNKPIEIKLLKGKERIIQFPSNVSLGMPVGLRNILKMSNAAGVVYITPEKTFPKTRIQAKLDNGEIIYIDLFSVKPHPNESSEEFKIVHQAQVNAVKSKYEKDGTNDKNNTKNKLSDSSFKRSSQSSSFSGVSLKKMLQYAIIDLYGVNRLKANLPISESEIKTPLNLDFVFTGKFADMFELKAFKQYRSTSYTVTAIYLRNKTRYRQLLTPSKYSQDPNALALLHVYPAMLSVSAFPNFVEPRSKGKLGGDDTATLFIVTERPLNEYSFYSQIVTGKGKVDSKGVDDE